MSDDLDEVALLLAQSTLEFRSSFPNRLIEAPERRDDRRRKLLGLVGVAAGMVSLFRRTWRPPGPVVLDAESDADGRCHERATRDFGRVHIEAWTEVSQAPTSS